MKTVEVYVMEGAVLPNRKHKDDAGLDLYAFLPNRKEVVLEPGDMEIISTGVVVRIPEGNVGLVWPKSKHNFVILGGVIDAGYQGEIMVKVVNPLNTPLTIVHNQAIAQLLLQPIYTPEVVAVTFNEMYNVETERGSTGGIHESVW